MNCLYGSRLGTVSTRRWPLSQPADEKERRKNEERPDTMNDIRRGLDCVSKIPGLGGLHGGIPRRAPRDQLTEVVDE